MKKIEDMVIASAEGHQQASIAAAMIAVDPGAGSQVRQRAVRMYTLGTPITTIVTLNLLACRESIHRRPINSRSAFTVNKLFNRGM
jgi:hypothetical protein